MLPTLREKKRYILFSVLYNIPISKNEIKETIFKGILNFLGEYDTSYANPKLISFDDKTQIGILKCSRSEVLKVKAALALVSRSGNKRISLRALRVSGSLNKMRRKYLSELPIYK